MSSQAEDIEDFAKNIQWLLNLQDMLGDIPKQVKINQSVLLTLPPRTYWRRENSHVHPLETPNLLIELSYYVN